MTLTYVPAGYKLIFAIQRHSRNFDVPRGTRSMELFHLLIKVPRVRADIEYPFIYINRAFFLNIWIDIHMCKSVYMQTVICRREFRMGRRKRE